MKTILKRFSASVLAVVFLVTFAVPRSRAVTGVDDTTLGIMAVIVHLQSVGGELAVTQGTALATSDAVTSLATQAGAAGVFGAGVTGASALATIGAAVTAAAGGFTIGYVGYETLSKLAEWIRQSKLTGTSENKIYKTGGSYDVCTDGHPTWEYYRPFHKIYTTEAGSAFFMDASLEDGSNSTLHVTLKTVSINNVVSTVELHDLKWAAWDSTSSSYIPSTYYYLLKTPPGTSGEPRNGVYARGNRGLTWSGRTE